MDYGKKCNWNFSKPTFICVSLTVLVWCDKILENPHNKRELKYVMHI